MCIFTGSLKNPYILAPYLRGTADERILYLPQYPKFRVFQQLRDSLGFRALGLGA